MTRCVEPPRERILLDVAAQPQILNRDVSTEVHARHHRPRVGREAIQREVKLGQQHLHLLGRRGEPSHGGLEGQELRSVESQGELVQLRPLSGHIGPGFQAQRDPHGVELPGAAQLH
jgi:hypothetical protein